MLAIKIELLAGRYTATAHNDRGRAEWPPHPARFFSALVAAHHDRLPGCGGGEDEAAERQALHWLENQPPPSLDVDPADTEDTRRRTVLDVYVPVNDVTLVGDPEAPVRAAQSRLSANAGGPAERKAAERALAKEQTALASFLAAQQQEPARVTAKDLETASSLIPTGRTRQVRTFPTALPSRPDFAFVWPGTPPPEVRTGLERLCSRVTRLGHSSSLVRCAVDEAHHAPNLVPADDGSVVLRVVGPGQLGRLEREHLRHRGVESRVLPSRSQRYRVDGSRSTGIPAASSVLSSDPADWVVFERVEGARPMSSRGCDLASALRAALMEVDGSGALPPVVSGHSDSGRPAEVPHVAFVSLPFVGRAHADGAVLGCALVMPRDLPDADRAALLRLVARWETTRAVDEDGTVELAAPGLPPLRVRRVEVSEKLSLRPARWCQPSRCFTTVTPIALDRHPGNLRSNRDHTAHKAFAEAERCVADACTRIGLPRPDSVEISLVSWLPGVQPARAFAPWPRHGDRGRRALVHADLRFARPVCGPLLLGAGRYFGLGLCLPVREERDAPVA